MRRRDLLALTSAAALPAGLSRPARAQASQARVLRYVPVADLASIDPILSTAVATRNHAYMIFESLYGLDQQLVPQPQMAEGHEVTEDGLRWTFRLRDGLRFHNGEPVLARDCVASISRWMQRILPGITLAQRVESLTAPDDRTVEFRLKQPFPQILWILAKATPSVMPAHLAATPPNRAVAEAIGSGPFRFMAAEYSLGSQAVYERFAAYRPRSEPASFTAGGRIAQFDRVEWRSIPDASTASAALMQGEVDWIEAVLPDMLPLLQRRREVETGRLDQYGLIGELVLNHLQGPTANKGIRQAILAAIDQSAIMQLAAGDSRFWHAPIGCFTPGTPSANDAAMERIGTPVKPVAEIQAMLRAAGYKGEKLVLLHAGDHPFYSPMMQGVEDRLKQVGFNVDAVTSDQNTVYQRRLSKEPIERGGWSAFVTAGSGLLDFSDPASSSVMRGLGLAGFYGWPDNPRVEAIRDAWLAAREPAEQLRLAREMQAEQFETGHWVPLGQYFQFAAWRRDLRGVARTPVPLFWGVSRG